MKPVNSLFRFLFLRPTLGILISIMFVFGGWMAWSNMAKEANPDLDIPMALVQTEWPGADPETIEQAVTEKLEEELRSLKKLKKLRSASFNSFSLISVEFDAGADTTDAMNRLRTKVDEAIPELPPEVEKPSITQKQVDDTPVISFALSGEVGPSALGRLAIRLQDQLEKLPGVNEVELSGNQDEIVLVRLLPSRLISLGLSPLKVRDAIKQSNQDMPWDQFDGEQLSGSMRLYARFRDVEQLKKTPVMRLDSGRQVYLHEIAEVRRDLERETSRAALSWHGAEFEPTIDLSVKKLSGVDTIKLIELVKKEMQSERQSTDWPHGIEYQVTADQSDAIWENLNNVFNNAWQAMLGVFLVLLVVLSWREALIAGLAIPLTFLGSLAIVWLLGFTLNTLVIVGLVLALGLLVDVFILMMEGMHDNIFSKKKNFDDAAIATVKAYSAPAFAGQMTTILAMAPLLAIGGVSGKFIQIVPLTTIVALVMSFIIALLVTIPLSRFLLAKVDTGGGPSRIDQFTTKVSAKLLAWSKKYSLKNHWTALAWVAGSMLLLMGSLFLAGMLSSTMFPKADGRNLGITMELPPDTTLDQSQACADALGEVLRSKSYFQSVVKFTGAKSPMALNSPSESLTPSQDRYLVGFSAYFISLNERDQFAYQYLDSLRPELEEQFPHCPGGQLTLVPQLGGTSNEDPIQIIVTGDDLGSLRKISSELQQALVEIPGATDVRDSMGASTVDIKNLPRREALDFYKVSVNDLAQQTRIAMATDKIGEFDLGGTEDELVSLIWAARKMTWILKSAWLGLAVTENPVALNPSLNWFNCK
jgi:multidrug efflux pump subunit AcrB